MGVMFAILAFVTVMGVVIPVANVYSPFSASYVMTPSAALNSTYVGQLGGVSCDIASGTCTGNATLAGGTASSGIFGSGVTTQLIFGNFFAGAQYLVSLAVGIAVPGQYVFGWLYDVFGDWGAAIAMAAIFQALAMIAYSNEMFYIITGRWIFPP